MKAFPTTIDNEGYQEDHSGMDLRDYFAAKVMGALIKHEVDYISHFDHDNEDYRFPFFDEDLNGKDEIKDIATRCYQFADAMMRARK